MTFEPKYTITDAIAVALTAIERARGFLEAAKLSEDWIAGMQRRALVLEAHAAGVRGALPRCEQENTPERHQGYGGEGPPRELAL